MAHKAVGDQGELANAAAKINSNLANGGTPRRLGTAAPTAKEPTFAEQAKQRISAIKKGTAAAQDAAKTES